MRKSLKRILTAALSALAFVAAGFGVSALKTVDVAKAEGELAITGRTLNVSNNVNVVFLIQAEVGDAEKVKVVAKEVNAVDGTEEDPVTLSATGTYTDESTATVYHQYIYKGVEAKEMPNVVYAYAYHVDNPTVLSATRKFSIIEYAHTSLASGADSKLDTLIKATLDYGEAAAAFEDQNLPADYLNDYKLWELDESTNATFADGFDYSYVYEGQKVAIKPATNYVPAAGVDYLEDNGDGTYTYTVPAELPNFENVFVDNSDNISDADKAQTVLDAITVDTMAVAIGDTLTLNTTPVNFEDEATISWEVSGATLDGNVVTFDTKGTATLTATVTCGEVSRNRLFTVKAYELMPEKTYTFADYEQGTQYADNEEHVLDEYVTVVTTQCYFTTELRVYSSDAHNGSVIIKVPEGMCIAGLGFNAGNAGDTINIYGSDDSGDTWRDVESVDVVSTYKNYSTVSKFFYQYLKLDVERASQVRLKSITVTIGLLGELPELPSEEEIVTDAANAFALGFDTMAGNEQKTLPSTAAENVAIVWSLPDNAAAALNGYVLSGKGYSETQDISLTASFRYGSAEGQEYATETYTITVTAVSGEGGDEPVAKTWKKVTDVSQLKVGAQVVIVAKDYDYALGDTQNSNNRAQAEISKANDTLTYDEAAVEVLTLCAGTTDGTFAFQVEEGGYLYAASSTKNYLRTENTLSANSSWTIVIATDGTATVIAQGSNTRNVMQYNQSSSLFACYDSASQKAICIYFYEE